MTGINVLTVSSEVTPYWEDSEVSLMSYRVPKMIHEQGGNVRIFMPRFGTINERRYQLHEVIRLSGMNMVINDTDMHLTIKVATIPKDRIQVYFIDNDDYFKRKAKFTDSRGNLFEDNDERLIFFAKGVIETIKKLNWVPDIIHVHGWMSAILPLYLRTFYKTENLVKKSIVITSIYEKEFEGTLPNGILKKLSPDNIKPASAQHLKTPDYDNVIKTSIDYSDAVIIASPNSPENLVHYAKERKKKILYYIPEDQTKSAYTDFYNQLLTTS